MKRNPHIQKAIELLGGFTATARAVGAPSYQSVQQWVESGQVPAKYCAALEKLTGISRGLFRPDDFQMYWPELKEGEHA